MNKISNRVYWVEPEVMDLDKKEYPNNYLEISMYDKEKNKLYESLMIFETDLTKKERRGLTRFIEQSLNKLAEITTGVDKL